MIDHEEGLHESDVKVENRMFIFFRIQIVHSLYLKYLILSNRYLRKTLY